MHRGAVERSVRIARSTLQRSSDRWIKVTMRIIIFSILAIAIVSGTERTCEPGKAFKHYCNNCRCGNDGLVKSAACTKMACPEGMFNEDGTRNEPRGYPVTRSKRQATCEPGKAFKKYCNSCTCGTDGSAESAACTRMECVPGMWNEDGSLRQPLTDPTPRDKRQAGGADATCVPGTSYNYYCNTCRCGADGLRKSAMCTRAECPETMWNEDGSLKEPLSDPTPRDKRQANPTEGTCEPGKVFKHYCNDCHCGPDGLVRSAACTEMGCPEGVFNEDGSLKQPLTDPTPRDKRQTEDAGATCEPGTSFNWYCNTCLCGDDGLRKSAGCTRKGCSTNVWNEDGSLKTPLSDPIPRDKRQIDGFGATCEPGKSFKLYCNTCQCPPNGMRDSAACTLMACPGDLWNADGSLKTPLSDPIPRSKRQTEGAGATCVPGTSFKWYCNTCHCGDDGLRESAACTRKGCSEDVWNEDGSLKTPLSDPIPRSKRQTDGAGGTCVPGTSFEVDCNTCQCPANGMRGSAACTLVGCVKGTWNADGSWKTPLSDPIPRSKRQTDGAGATCVPGTSFKWYCNTCHCGDDGLRESAACTRKGCSEDVWNADGSLKTPLSDPIPRDKRQTDKAGTTCVPGTSFNWYCNTCHCPANGLRSSAACTLMGCPEGMWNEDGSLKTPLSDPIPSGNPQTDLENATCEPGKSFKHYCNTCHCPANGLRASAACTLVGCPEGVWNEDGSLKTPLSDPIPRDKRQTPGTGATCEPGKSFKHYCNTCHCPANGLRASAVCTLVGCPEGVWNEDGSLKTPLSDPIPRDKRQTPGTGATCEPGKSFKHYCNTCHCPANGLRASAACTLMACPGGMWNEDGSLKTPLSDPIPRNKRQTPGTGATCEPGKSFKHYCNTCHCPANGLRASAACTLMACPGGMWNEDGSLKTPLSDPIPRNKRQTPGTGATCEPGKSFKVYCNTCHCPANGLRDSAACTLMACPGGMWNEDGSLKTPLSDPIPRDKRQTDGAGATCEPGKSFKVYCNTCHCPANGMRDSAACTLMACPGGMWNEDGSLKTPLSDPIPRSKRQAWDDDVTY